MYEILITIGKGIQQIFFALIIGSIFINLISNGFNKYSSRYYYSQLVKILLVLILTLSPILLLIQSAYYHDNNDFLLNIFTLKRTLIDTRFGNYWCLKTFLLIILLLMTWKSNFFNYKIFLVLLLFTSSLVSFTGHSAALDLKYIGTFLNILHIIAINIWFGTLPFIIYKYYNDNNKLKEFIYKFTKVASVCMFLIITSGISLSILNLEYSFAALIGTKYGYLILLKIFFLIIILFCAFLIKFFYLNKNKPINIVKILKIEIFFASLVFIFGIILSQTIPGAHDEINWPLNFRISTEVAFESKQNLQIFKFLSIFFFASLGVIIADYIFNKNLKRFILVLSIISFIVLPFTIKILSVEAYPVTYKIPSVPYSAISVFNGKNLYLENCTICHGRSGQGDGELANDLSEIPPANLTEPHTAYHTAGDIYWWLTYGKPPSSMPGFEGILTEDERWDIINYLRTLSAGYEGRILSDIVIKDQPWLASIDFDYVRLNKSTGRLSKYRFNNLVMIVFFNYNEANLSRIIELNTLKNKYTETNTELILVPNFNKKGDKNLNELKNFVNNNNIQLPIIYEGAKEITETYKLYRRTLENPDKYDENEYLNYMEVLIDKYGYVRGRWIVYDKEHLLKDSNYFQMLEKLFLEKQIIPPPDEHVH